MYADFIGNDVTDNTLQNPLQKNVKSWVQLVRFNFEIRIQDNQFNQYLWHVEIQNHNNVMDNYFET